MISVEEAEQFLLDPQHAHDFLVQQKLFDDYLASIKKHEAGLNPILGSLIDIFQRIALNGTIEDRIAVEHTLSGLLDHILKSPNQLQTAPSTDTAQ